MPGASMTEAEVREAVSRYKLLVSQNDTAALGSIPPQLRAWIESLVDAESE